MRILFLPIALALLGTSVRAHDEKDSRYYLQWGLGGVFSESVDSVTGGPVDFNPGFATSLALGRRIPLSSRTTLNVEAEAYYQYFTADKGDLLGIPSATDDDASALAILVNGILNWQLTHQYSMYGGFGLGFAQSIDYSPWDSGSLSITDSSGVAFQGKLGLDYNLGGNYDVLLGYRYFKTEPIDIHIAGGGTEEIDVGQHVFELTFRWGL